ncbi:unnamed protein product, partial [Chrysoparadoxa australica]
AYWRGRRAKRRETRREKTMARGKVRNEAMRAQGLPCCKTWRTLSATGFKPPMREKSSAVMVKGKLWLFGGLNAGPSPELWVFDATTCKWSCVPPGKGPQSRHPPARHSATLSCAGDDLLYLFGGQGQGSNNLDAVKRYRGIVTRTVGTMARRTCLNDLWLFDTREGDCGGWREVIQAACPSPRRGHTACVIHGRRPAGVFSDGAASSCRGGTGSNTSLGSVGSLGSSGSMGSRAGAHSLTPAPVNDSRELFVIGGAGFEAVKNMEVVYGQCWILDLDTCQWTMVESEGPSAPALYEHTATACAEGKSIIVIGGLQAGRQGSVAIHNLDIATLTWSVVQMNPLSFLPGPMCGHCTTLDPTNHERMLIYGDRGGNSWSGNILAYNVNKKLMNKAVTEGEKHGSRYGHIMAAYDGPDPLSPNDSELRERCLLMYGGTSAKGGYADSEMHVLEDTVMREKEIPEDGLYLAKLMKRKSASRMLLVVRGAHCFSSTPAAAPWNGGDSELEISNRSYLEGRVKQGASFPSSYPMVKAFLTDSRPDKASSKITGKQPRARPVTAAPDIGRAKHKFAQRSAKSVCSDLSEGSVMRFARRPVISPLIGRHGTPKQTSWHADQIINSVTQFLFYLPVKQANSSDPLLRHSLLCKCSPSQSPNSFPSLPAVLATGEPIPMVVPRPNTAAHNGRLL